MQQALALFAPVTLASTFLFGPTHAGAQQPLDLRVAFDQVAAPVPTTSSAAGDASWAARFCSTTGAR